MVGNLPNYTQYDVLSAFLHIEDGMSREALTKKLSLGEGSVRSILDELKRKNLLKGTQHGHYLTEHGAKQRRQLLKKLMPPKSVQMPFYPELVKVAIVIHERKNLELGYKQRDVAVKNCAEGALLLQVRNGKLVLPGFSENYSLGMLEKEFPLQEHDVMVVAFAKKRHNAERAAIAVAQELMS